MKDAAHNASTFLMDANKALEVKDDPGAVAMALIGIGWALLAVNDGVRDR
jgi:hypothetical protein